MRGEKGVETDAFRHQAMAADGRATRTHPAGNRPRTPGAGGRDRPVRLPRPVPRPVVPRRTGRGTDCAVARDAARNRPPPVARPCAHHDRAPDGDARAGRAPRPAIRQDRGARSSVVRRGAHRRGDAVGGRWRRAVANLLRSVPAAGGDRSVCAAGDLRFHCVLGRARRRRHAGRGAVHPGRAIGGAQAHRSGLARTHAGLQVVRRRAAGRDPGAADTEGVRPERRLWTDAGRQGARAVREHDDGAGHQRPDARRHRSRLRARRSGERSFWGRIACGMAR